MQYSIYVASFYSLDRTTVVLNYNFGDTNEIIDINLVVFLLIHDCCLVLCLLCCWYNF